MCFCKTTDARKYVDLIYKRCGSFANVDPGCPIEPGDYGIVDKVTGKFETHGNIRDVSTTQILFESSKASLVKGVELPFRDIRSVGVIKRDYNANAAIDCPWIVQTSFGALFKFGKKRAATLVMRKPATSTLTKFDSILTMSDYSFLKGKHLVWEVVTCTSFLSYLSDKVSEQMEVSFDAKAPAASAAGVTVGAELSAGWISTECGGEKQIGDERPGVKYTTLFRTRAIGKKKFTQRNINNPPLEEQDNDCWLDSQVPWKKLDDDGNEIEDEDYETSDDGSDED